MLKQVLEKVANPGAEFRGVPFWAWNAKLEEGELREQIRTMKKMGLGGFFMHARVGLNTPYLSEEWFKLVAACVDEAKKQGMKAWLYDEDRWPSGAAGGLVTKDKRYRMRYMHFIIDQEFPKNEDSVELARFAVCFSETTIAAYRRIRKGAKLEEGEHLMIFNRTINPAGNSWFNGQNYLDVLNPEAVKKFVEVTHEAYLKHLPKDMGKAVPGIFTDEPNMYADSPVDSLPWTDGLEKTFKKRFGYDLLDHLPELYYPYRPEIARQCANQNLQRCLSIQTAKSPFEFHYCCVNNLRPEFSKVRLDYRNLLGDLFSRAFGKTIGDWCDKNGVLFTGHVLREDTLLDQAQAVGSTMRFYEYMSAPGIDLLTEHWNIFITAKQCTSAAHQFGRKIRLSETYGCTGWDFPFMGHKALGDWQYALGINLRCQHLAWYSMAAEAKRDYPASISYQSPWWKEHYRIENYFAHLGAALSEGEEQRDLLLIHPVESLMGSYTNRIRVKGEKKMDIDLDRQFIRLTNELLAIHLDYDFGEEELMSRHASVAGRKLKVGKAAYQAVLIPDLMTIRATTLELLEKFADNGGKVFCLDEAPEYLDGVKSEKPAQVYRKFRRISEAELDRALTPIVRRVSIYNDTDSSEVSPALYMLKKGRNFESLFVCNTGRTFTEDQKNIPLVRERQERFPEAKVAWVLPEDYQVYQLDLETGKLHRQNFERYPDMVVFDAPLEPLESRMFFATNEELKAAAPLRPLRPIQGGKALPDTRCKIELDEPNVLVLDTPAYRIDGGKKQAPDFCLRLDVTLREMLGAPKRGGRMVQPWLRGKAKAKRQLDLELEYTFECETVPAGDCKFALERPDLYAITFNGKPVDKKDCGWWCDRAIRLVNLPAKAFKKGKNTIQLTSKYDESLPGLESMFLLGDFGVENDVLTKPVRSLKFGDWTKQGLTYYSGNLTYAFDVPEGAKQIEFPAWRGVALAYALDGEKEFTTLGWPPFTFRTNGAKKVKVKVFGHRRNAMGPFFTLDKWPSWTGPAQFQTYETTERGIVPCGILEPPKCELK